jgi:hypothetical protein
MSDSQEENKLVIGPFPRLPVIGLLAFALFVTPQTGHAQNSRCDPAHVVGSESCARCHVNESATWKNTPHCQTFEELGRSPAAQQICQKLGIRSVKRSDLCIDCHFTAQSDGEKTKPIEGVSCESCHGAAANWINQHNQFLSSTGTKEAETAPQRFARLANSTKQGMYNTRNLYQIASNCLNCHTIPHENLVNLGGHSATSEEFEFVRWSQGSIRHNFLRTQRQSPLAIENGVTPVDQLRVMYVVGLIADLEYSTRATAQATQKSTYGITAANRAARVAVKLFEVQQKIHNEHLQSALDAFAKAELKLNRQAELSDVANQIRLAGEAFATNADGKELSALDQLLPKPSEYR